MIGFAAAAFVTIWLTTGSAEAAATVAAGLLAIRQDNRDHR